MRVLEKNITVGELRTLADQMAPNIYDVPVYVQIVGPRGELQLVRIVDAYRLHDPRAQSGGYTDNAQAVRGVVLVAAS